ncbi:MAG: hypothetical protein ACK4YP_18170 [Myxococcota bacterium]
MDAETPAGLIIADTFANQVGRHLREHRRAPLARLSQALVDDFGIGVAVAGRAGDLPTFTADGPCDQAVRDSLSMGTGVVPDGESWAEEQARRWIAEVAR